MKTKTPRITKSKMITEEEMMDFLIPAYSQMRKSGTIDEETLALLKDFVDRLKAGAKFDQAFLHPEIATIQ
jgi:hypothetical protein